MGESGILRRKKRCIARRLRCMGNGIIAIHSGWFWSALMRRRMCLKGFDWCRVRKLFGIVRRVRGGLRLCERWGFGVSANVEGRVGNVVSYWVLRKGGGMEWCGRVVEPYLRLQKDIYLNTFLEAWIIERDCYWIWSKITRMIGLEKHEGVYKQLTRT